MTRTLTFCIVSFASVFFLFNSYGQAVPADLKCEHLVSPMGIDNPSPRLTWRMADDRPGAVQSAYRIVAGTDLASVDSGSGDVWDSGKISSRDLLAVYGGKPLEPFTRYYWTVTIWDGDGNESRSETAWFETGMMGTERWQGNWISDRHDTDYKPAPCFRREFDAAKEIASARAYIAVAGLYELYINGERIGDRFLDPMYTRFDRRNLYVTYDVTDNLRKGGNAVGVLLGNGWYNHQSIGVWDFERAPWRQRPAFCLDLHLTYTDGSSDIVKTDLGWKTAAGPLIFNSIYTAEHYDARLEVDGWAEPGFDDSGWSGVRLRSVPSPQVTAQQTVPIRKVEEYAAISLRRLDENSWLYDFGQNMSGVTQLRLSGPAGTEVKLIHTERLHPDGHADQSNIDVYYRGDKTTDPFQTDVVYLSGRGEDRFEARFNYKGFRYVEVVTSVPLDLAPGNLTAYFVHSDVPAAGTLESSSDLINGLWRATNYAYLSNLMGYPTDCPQREKNGWTGDGHLAIETALYNFDGITVYEKWLGDHRDEQQPNGVLPDIIPTGGWGYGTDNGLDWTSTIAIIPWNLYLFYGDTKPLADNYYNIKRYVDYVDRNSPDGLTSWGRGDWVPVSVPSNKELTSSVYFYVDTDILAKAAKMFGRDEDYRYYSSLAEKIKHAINEKYLDRSTCIYATGTQTELSVPLFWGVVPDDMRTAVAANLARKVEDAGYHLDVGVLGAKALLDALCLNGYPEHAYKVAVQDTYPSWGWWVVNGATTLLENWDLDAQRDISDNHMMFGEIGGWFFKGLGGIRPDPEAPGFRKVILTPYFPDGLDSFGVSHNSPNGPITSRWTRKKNRVEYTVIVPANSTATLILPSDIEGYPGGELASGEHTFRLTVKK